jgi:hypothetical protein
MKTYKIIIFKEAETDIQNTTNYIRNVHKQSKTAIRYRKGLYKTIYTLSFFAGSIGRNEYVQALFGVNARHVIFKNMSIIIFVEGDFVYVQRVIAASLIH